MERFDPIQHSTSISHLRLYTENLLFKHGFAEVMSDFKEENEFWPDGDAELSARVLVSLVKQFVLPTITQEYELGPINPSNHNPIKISKIDGIVVDWDADLNTAVEFECEYVNIPNDVVFAEFEKQKV